MTDVWDKTRYPAWRRRILAVPDGETIREVNGRRMVVKTCTEGRRLSALMRAWERAKRSLND